MQKWEYIMIFRSRGTEKKENEIFRSSLSWLYYIWIRGANEAQEWKGDNIVDLLCEIGDLGWELVSHAPKSDFLGGYSTPYNCGIDSGYAGWTSSETLIFKRPKE